MFTAGPQLLFNKDSFLRSLARVDGLESNMYPLAVSSALYLSVVGFGIGLYHSFQQALSSAVKLPLLLLFTLAICLPILYLFALGLRDEPVEGTPVILQVTAVVLSGVCASAFLLLLLSPAILYAELNRASHSDLQLITVGIFLISGAVGMSYIWRGMRYVDAAVTSIAGRMLLLVWSLLACLVGAELSWRLRPIIGDPQNPFLSILTTDEDIIEGTLHGLEDALVAASTGTGGTVRVARVTGERDIAPSQLPECAPRPRRDDVSIVKDGSASGRAFPARPIVVTVVDFEHDWSSLWAIDPNDPSNSAQLTNTECSDLKAIWSPDGSRLVFSRRGPHNLMSLWVVNADGTGERQILKWWNRGTGSVTPLFWFLGDPSGERVYYVKDGGGGPCRFMWIYADASRSQTEHTLAGADNICQPEISQDARSLVFFSYGSGRDLQIADLSADGTSLTNRRVLLPILPGLFEMSEPAWSPDGSRIALSMDPGGYRSQVYTIASDGSDLQPPVAISGSHANSVTWSPDGEWLAFVLAEGSSRTSSIVVVPSDGSSSPLVTLTARGRGFGQPDW